MKITLTILCGLMILLAGGCVLASAGDMNDIALLNLLIIVPNALLIAAMYGYSGPLRPVFIILAIVDFIIALLVGGCVISLAQGDVQFLLLGVVIGGAFLLKGALTWAMSNRLKRV